LFCKSFRHKARKKKGILFTIFKTVARFAYHRLFCAAGKFLLLRNELVGKNENKNNTITSQSVIISFRILLFSFLKIYLNLKSNFSTYLKLFEANISSCLLSPLFQ